MDYARSVDHRWSSRRPCMFYVTLDDGVQACRGTVRNLSLGGMYVQAPEAELSLNSQLVLGFQLGEGAHADYYRLPALVVHLTRDGAGIMFKDYDEDTIQSLRRVFHETVVDAWH